MPISERIFDKEPALYGVSPNTEIQKDIFEKIKIYKSYNPNEEDVFFHNVKQLLLERHKLSNAVCKTEEAEMARIDYIKHINKTLVNIIGL